MRIETLIEVARKELRLFFGSPIGYLFLAAYLGVTLFVFFWGEAFFARGISDARPMFEWLPVLLIFLTSALTMRIWSDERRTGTLEFIVTLPASAWELVAGKFLACLLLLAIALVLTLPLPITVAALANLDWGPVLAGYVAALLLGASYISIGLFVSARSENQIVSLIVAAFICGIFYLLGSDFLTGFVTNEFAELLRELGSGSRFESITRGVLDFSDLYFYVSVTAVFLILNVFAVKSFGWAEDGDAARHRNAFRTTGLIVANVVIANIWLSYIPYLRWDVTEGDQFSIAPVTELQLEQLQEPLLLRGYFSSKTHPLLAPLVPQLRDLLQEYSVVGGNRVQVEFVDPVTNAELEDEANTKYGIRPVPFQVADRHQASLVNSYFDVLIHYGDEYEVLGFRDLIEVKATTESELAVQLRNPEYDITRAIKKVLAGFQGGGSIFDSIATEIAFTGYISSPERLPEGLETLRQPLTDALHSLENESGGIFSWSFVDPEDGDGSVALEIAEKFGFQPMAASLFDTNRFYFYLTLSDGQVVVSMAIPDTADHDAFKRTIEEGLKRFATGLLTSVAFHAPTPPPPQYMGQPSMGSQYGDFRAYLTNDYDVDSAMLRDPVSSSSDVLIVVDPSSLDDKQVFEIDQFLMQGGTVVIAAGAFKTTLVQQSLSTTSNLTGLDDWLAHHGISIDKSMVLDEQNSAFPIPVTREVGGFTFQEIRMFPYPFFVDVRGDGLVADNPIVRDLDQLTFAWGSPVEVDLEMNNERDVVELLRSSNTSWTETSPNVMPEFSETMDSAMYKSTDELKSRALAVSVEGQFSSFFDESPALIEARERARELEEAETAELSEESLAELAEASEEDDTELASETDPAEEEAEEEEDTVGIVATVIDRSPESARLIVVGSADFLSDQVIRMISASSGSMYVNSFQFVANIIDVAMEDASLLSIRNRGHFNRSLPPLSTPQQQLLEYGNYAVAIVLLVAVFGVNLLLRRRRRAQHASWFGVSP